MAADELGEWQPLPKRTRKRAPRAQGPAHHPQQPPRAQLDSIAANVEARAQLQRADQLEGHAKTTAIGQFEYLDHTADVQLHAWGVNHPDAFAHAALAMFHYMSDLRAVRVDAGLTRAVTMRGRDAKELLFRFLDELLFAFSTEGLLCARVTVDHLEGPSGDPDAAGSRGEDGGGGGGGVADGDREWTLTATLEGETFDLRRHPQGTEVKAITYSNMQIHRKDDDGGRVDVFVIIDI